VSTHLQQTLEALYGLERRKDKLGVEGTRSVLGALGDPHRRFRSVHVAGTNGKGTVCALIERVLRQAGYRTGLFTSPHLVDFRERIRVDGRWVDEAWLEGRLDHLQRLREGRERTFFEVCTALAFDTFAAREVEVAVVEVGLGGRLDCTNVIVPEVSVITSIGLDHTEILGRTIEQIAFEKAGIIKPGVPVVCGPMEGEARRVIAQVAAERGAPDLGFREFEVVERRSGGQRGRLSATPWGDLELDLEMTGDFQLDNAALALAALAALARSGLRIEADAVRGGFGAARWPGRLEAAPGEPRLWWDGAHNLQAIEALARAWPKTGNAAPGCVVLAVSRDKDVAAMLAALSRLGCGGRMVATRSRSERAMDPEPLAAAAAAAGWRPLVAPDVPAACRTALAVAGRSAPVLLTGSLFAIGEAMEAFGGAPGERL
jgi:dihydrofolate synthase/folylpolyglutamate synthase